MDLVWLLGADDWDIGNLSARTIVIYQGHHGDRGAHRADLIFPGAAYTEKDGLYANTEGRVQLARRAVSPPGEAREDWKIIRALSDYVGKTLPYNDLFQLRQRLVKEWPHFGRIDSVTPGLPSKITSKNKVLADDFKPVYEDYYLTDPICRASAVMGKCSEAFVSSAPASDRMEAAE